MTDKELAQSIYIKPEEVDLFKIAWETLMSKFSIPKDHQTPLFDVMVNYFLRLDHHSLYIYELNSAINVLDFFISYSIRFDEIKKGKSPFEIDKISKVRFELAALEIELKYPNVSTVAITALYNHFRKYDNFLHSYLSDYEYLPTLNELNLIKSKLGDERDDKMQLYVIGQIEDIKAYIGQHLSKELSRKINYFIFELLYLFNIIKYAGKVGGSNSEGLALINTSGNAKFNTYALMADKEKSRYVTTIVANAAKKEKGTI